MSSSNSTPVMWDSKFGRIEIYTGGNYANWFTGVTLALNASGAHGIVTGDLIRPEPFPSVKANQAQRAQIEAWDKYYQSAVQIVTGSLDNIHKAQVLPFIISRNIIGAWTLLTSSHPALQPTYRYNVMTEFYKESFDPATDTIRGFFNRLLNWQTQLAGTADPIPDSIVIDKAIRTLPSSESWAVAKQLIQIQAWPLNKIIDHLGGLEKPIRSADQNAYAAHDNNRGRSNKRGRGRGRGRGRSGSSREGGISKDSNRICFWCEKKGHLQANCYKYKNAKSQDKTGANSSKDSIEQTSVAITHEKQSYYDAYSASPISANSAADSNIVWLLDSGAFRHFTGYRIDFSTYESWDIPRRVTIANGSEVEAIGIGIIYWGKLRFRDVWHVPSFQRLLSISTLIDHNIQVRFNKDGAVGYTSNLETVFIGQRERNLWVVNGPIRYHNHHNNQGGESYAALVGAEETKAELWHRRLCYTNVRDVKKLEQTAENFNIGDIHKRAGRHACEACLAGRMKEHFSKKTDARTPVRVRKLHADLSGILSPSIQKNRYFLLVVDDATRYIWVEFTKTKAERELAQILL
ncbi:hypothetical protein OCU04_008638 [Sclerotinia nivalis]|uniref:Integrase catalytic domain-containing protein n=1 Tax=Sclerotinia nivalis TaxID=352851 RepID=A0A9X0ALZ6_9HELO|nr:hypothetical protein OCU04_008638 [Sclerotinia nivalis]